MYNISVNLSKQVSRTSYCGFIYSYNLNDTFEFLVPLGALTALIQTVVNLHISVIR